MGEIKSTMDIIMEKTKGLTMSDEERNAFKEQELRGKIKGLVQRFLDGAVDADKLKIQMLQLERDRPDLVIQYTAEEAKERIRPGEPNETILLMLKAVCGLDTAPFHELFRGFEKEREKEKKTRETALRGSLLGKGISGSAVIPNLWADAPWHERERELKQEFHSKLMNLFAREAPP